MRLDTMEFMEPENLGTGANNAIHQLKREEVCQPISSQTVVLNLAIYPTLDIESVGILNELRGALSVQTCVNTVSFFRS